MFGSMVNIHLPTALHLVDCLDHQRSRCPGEVSKVSVETDMHQFGSCSAAFE